MKKTRSKELRNNVHQYKEIKEKLYSISFIHVGTTIEHQLQDMYASRNVQFFPSLRRRETNFRCHQGHQQAGALTSSIHNIQSLNITVNILEHQKSVNIKILGKRTNCFLEAIRVLFNHYWRKSYTRGRPRYGKKLAWDWWDLSFWIGKDCLLCVFLHQIFDSRCFVFLFRVVQ